MDTDILQSDGSRTDERGPQEGLRGGVWDRLRFRIARIPVWKRWAVGIPTGLLLVALTLVGLDAAIAAGRIHPGVRVDDISVGGMRVDSAADVLREEAGSRFEEPVTLTFEDRSWEVTAGAIGAAPEPVADAESAYRIGRRGSVWDRVSERASCWFEPTAIPLSVSSDPSATATVLDAIASEVETSPADAWVSVDGTQVVLHPAKVGVEIDRDQTTSALLRAFAEGGGSETLAVRLRPVAVSDADAQRAYEDALRMVSGPLELTYEDSSWTIPPEDIGSWIGFEKVPYEEAAAAYGSSEETDLATTGTAGDPATDLVTETTGTVTDGAGETSRTPEAAGSERMVLRATLLTEEVSRTVTPLTEGVGKPAVDARFQPAGERVDIIPGEIGLEVDIETVSHATARALTSESERVVELRTRAKQPELTTEDAEAMGIEVRLATYTTHYSSSNAPRVNNIHTLADSLDGAIVPPGEVFSFNRTAGKRTAEAGYQEAGTIVNGRLVPTLGGGICQVGTTFFNTVFFAGVEVVERYNHSFYISHYPTGRDATVSWGGPDLKFRNDTDHHLLIDASYTNSSVTISLYGTDAGREVAYSTGSWTDVKPHPVVETEDPELDEGVRVVEDGGVDGRSIRVTRTVTQGDTVVHEDVFVSRYNPKTEYVRVGTKPVEPEPSEEETALPVPAE